MATWFAFYCPLGYYFFVETSWPRKPGDKARIATYYNFASVRANDYTCRLRFYYHMWGDHIGNLSVKVRDTIGGPETTLWIRNGQVGNYWARAEVILQSPKDFQVHLGIVDYFVSSMFFSAFYIVGIAVRRCTKLCSCFSDFPVFPCSSTGSITKRLLLNI